MTFNNVLENKKSKNEDFILCLKIHKPFVIIREILDYKKLLIEFTCVIIYKLLI